MAETSAKTGMSSTNDTAIQVIFFLSQHNTSVVLMSFFDDTNGELCLWFIHNIAAVFNETVKKKWRGEKVSARWATN